MPKRSHSSDKDRPDIEKKRRKYEKLQKKVQKLREELSDSSEHEGEGAHTILAEVQVHAPPAKEIEDIQLSQSSDLEDVQLFEDISTQNPLIQDDSELLIEPQQELTDALSLELFGEDPSNQNKNVGEILPNLATRFEYSLSKGLDKDIISKIKEKHPVASNCKRLIPPLLNPEVASAIKNKDKIREDKYLYSMQEIMASGIMSLYKETEVALKEKRNLKYLADSTNVSLETFHKMSLHRRYLLSPYLNIKFKKMLDEQPIDKYLFGEKLLEKIKQDQTTKSALMQVSSIMKPKSTHFGPSMPAQRPRTALIPQPATSGKSDTRSLNYNVPSNRPKLKQHYAYNRQKRPSVHLSNQSNHQWRNRRPQ